MEQQSRASLLIVDDSRLFRKALEAMLAQEENLVVVGSVWNGRKAIEFIEKNPPDLVTLDLEMPELDGLGTLKAIKKFNRSRPDVKPVGVIMISSHTRKGADITLKALEMGAFDFIAKPEGSSLSENIADLSRQLLSKIRLYTSRRLTSQFLRTRSKVPVQPKPGRGTPVRKKATIISTGSIRAVLIGVSTGGPKALMEIMPSLCDRIEVPILIAQHMPATFTRSLARSLDSKCSHSVIESSDGTVILPRYVYVAPGGRHMEVRSQGTKVVAAINDSPPEKGCRPSVNALFQSAASVYGGDLIGIILTGMGEDGTIGSGMLKKRGAVIFAQDEATSVVWGMPGSVEKAGYVDRLLPLADIPEAIAAVVNRNGV